jgi:hypothetical protein
MLWTITTTHVPATALGSLLHKHPVWVRTFSPSFSRTHVFDYEAGPSRCTAVLLLEIEPLHLTQKRQTLRELITASDLKHQLHRTNAARTQLADEKCRR